MEDSVFTKIIKGEIPCFKVYEDEKTLAFLDIHPKTRGQTVVIPKKQVSFVWDLSEEDYLALMSTVHKVGQKLRQAFPDKTRIGFSVEGMDVNNHAHVVIQPFDTVEEFHTAPSEDAKPSNDELKELSERLKF